MTDERFTNQRELTTRWKEKPFHEKMNWQWRRLTASQRMLPDFLVIGAMRSGTTLLYKYLEHHPCVGRAFIKEVHFFDRYHNSGTDWYRSHFPTRLYARLMERRLKRRLLTGEATPFYLAYPWARDRVRSLLPSAKLIALLRNPVARAYSHYNLQVLRGREKRTFEEAIDQEDALIGPEYQRMIDDPDYYSLPYRWHSYRERGIYVDQLRHWMEAFPGEQLLVVTSERFFASPAEVMGEVCRFLDIPEYRLPVFGASNALKYPPMDPDTRRRLEAYFAPHNRRLEELLGIPLSWDEHRAAQS
jgi:hypothetical protein